MSSAREVIAQAISDSYWSPKSRHASGAADQFTMADAVLATLREYWDRDENFQRICSSTHVQYNDALAVIDALFEEGSE